MVLPLLFLIILRGVYGKRREQKHPQIGVETLVLGLDGPEILGRLRCKEEIIEQVGLWVK